MLHLRRDAVGEKGDRGTLCEEHPVASLVIDFILGFVVAVPFATFVVALLTGGAVAVTFR